MYNDEGLYALPGHTCLGGNEREKIQQVHRRDAHFFSFIRNLLFELVFYFSYSLQLPLFSREYWVVDSQHCHLLYNRFLFLCRGYMEERKAQWISAAWIQCVSCLGIPLHIYGGGSNRTGWSDGMGEY